MDSPRSRRDAIADPVYQFLLRRLRDARLYAQYTQGRAARALGRPLSFISTCERGHRRITPIELLHFGNLYGQSYDYFLPPLQMLNDSTFQCHMRDVSLD